eukprot:2257684-Alexandrium_andersonii.AAC.1
MQARRHAGIQALRHASTQTCGHAGARERGHVGRHAGRLARTCAHRRTSMHACTHVPTYASRHEDTQ